MDLGVPATGDCGLISDCGAAALVSRRGSIDWCCVPRFDSPSVFARLLYPAGGFCLLQATDDDVDVSRGYLEGTVVLETVIEATAGKVRILDLFEAPRRDRPRILRWVEGLSGSVELYFHFEPRFEYGNRSPWFEEADDGIRAMGGDAGIVVRSQQPMMRLGKHAYGARFTIREGESCGFTLTHLLTTETEADPPVQDHRALLQKTVSWWRNWSDKASLEGEARSATLRSALTLKALTYERTGAMAAAATTWIPEAPSGDRAWDYRYAWIRDCHWAAMSLNELGFGEEADGFRRFVERTTAGEATELQPVYRVDGSSELTETELDLRDDDTRGRITLGNDASKQLQLDNYGALLDVAWHWHERGSSPSRDYWHFLTGVLNLVLDRWGKPDCGLWEVRGERQHFVHSKVMCWLALERGIRLAEACGHPGPVEIWKNALEDIRETVETLGYDEGRGVFVRSFGSNDVDAALLRLPATGFVAYTDPRMIRTTNTIAEELDEGGLLRRYRGPDALESREGAFLACTFWLATCYVGQGRRDEAQRAYERAMSASNELGLFSEEYEPKDCLMLGNFPQGLTHLSQIEAAIAIERGQTPERI